jgi:hypothetical protein
MAENSSANTFVSNPVTNKEMFRLETVYTKK